MNNAIKFSEGGEILIKIQNDQEHTKVAIKDPGVGIDPSIIHKIFNIGESVTTSGTLGETGTGLGLV